MIDRADAKPGGAPTAEPAQDVDFEFQTRHRERLEKALGHRFEQPERLAQALRHSFWTHERTREYARRDAKTSSELADLENNERLEFLGDAVLGLAVAEALYAAHPDWREGELTRALHSAVEGPSLAALARRLGVGAALALGRTELGSGGEDKDSILENAMEAIVGALYLDGGIEVVKHFVARSFDALLADGASRVRRDPKTALQEKLMSEAGELPIYQLVGDSGIEGDDARFEAEVGWLDAPRARGIGRTKRAAEKAAAASALEAWIEAEPAEEQSGA